MVIYWKYITEILDTFLIYLFEHLMYFNTEAMHEIIICCVYSFVYLGEKELIRLNVL